MFGNNQQNLKVVCYGPVFIEKYLYLRIQTAVLSTK